MGPTTLPGRTSSERCDTSSLEPELYSRDGSLSSGSREDRVFGHGRCLNKSLVNDA
jgi:hypothetical protein